MLAFRFLKLQSLIDEKIFREYLNYNLFEIEGKSFFEIWREIEKEAMKGVRIWK